MSDNSFSIDNKCSSILFLFISLPKGGTSVFTFANEYTEAIRYLFAKISDQRNVQSA